MGKINWLASYPKSGNTWVRIFLINLLNPQLKTSVNQINRIPYSASRKLFDEYSGINSADLTDLEVENLRPLVWNTISKISNKNLIFKIHDAYRMPLSNKTLLTPYSSNAIIYLIRNPLDLVISYARFKNISFDQTILEMENPENCLAKSNSSSLKLQLPQLLSTWSLHVKSWSTQKDIPILVIKYEDLLANSFINFKKITSHLVLHYSDEEIRIAIDKSKFKTLKEEEEEIGFKEKFPESELFFRKGISGEGLKMLSKNQINRISKFHEEVMSEFGY